MASVWLHEPCCSVTIQSGKVTGNQGLCYLVLGPKARVGIQLKGELAFGKSSDLLGPS